MSYLRYPDNNHHKSIWCSKHNHWVIDFCQKALDERNEDDKRLIKEAKDKEFQKLLDSIFMDKGNKDEQK
jgi:hypothetical protein